MRGVFTFSFFLIIGFASAQRYAVVNNGNWNSAATWASSPNGAGGAGVPTALDDVYTNGRAVQITTNVQCKNLFISYATSNSITFPLNNLVTVSINGYLAGYDDLNAGEAIPSVADVIVIGEDQTLSFLGTGQKIGVWRHTAALSNVTFNPGAGQSIEILSGFRVAEFGVIRLLSGTLTTATSSTSNEIRGCDECSFIISAGATFDTKAAINGGSTTTEIGNVTVNGTLITSNYVNADDFDMGATGLFQTSFSGTNQTQGWWRQGITPASGTINSTSTIEYTSDAAQFVSTRTYGNLTLSGLGTKTLFNAASLSVNNLTISTTFNSDASTGITISGTLSNSATWAPADLVVFSGTTAATITGTSTTSFNGGLEVNRSNTLSLARTITVANGLSVNAGTLNLGSQIVNLSGNLDNDGTITQGSSTVNITGSSSVTGTVAVTLNHVTVSSGQTFSPNSGFTVAGTFTNNGILNLPSGTVNFNGNYINNSASGSSIVSNNGTVVFGGSSTQTISGSAANAFNNITINNATLNQGTINLSGAFTLGTSASFNASSGSGVFNILSTSLSSSGRIAAFTGSTSNFSGTVTIQRYIDAKEDYRFLSYPILNGNVAGWQDDFPVTGFSGESCTADGTIIVDCSAASIYRFDPAIQDYVAVSGTTYAGTPLSSRVGYTAFSYGVFSGRTIDMTGSIESGSVQISNLGTGYNLVPNPYPSPIDWDNVDRTNTNNTVYLTTAEGTSASYVAGTNACTGCSFNNSWRGEIAIGQSYWINRTTGGTMTYEEDDKTGSATFVRENSEADYFRIVLESNGQKDDAVVLFKQGTTGGYDFGVDAPKRRNGYYDESTGRYSYINLSTFQNDVNQDMAINTMSPIQCNGNIKLKVQDLAQGTHALKVTDLANLTLGYKLTLKDNFTGNQTPVEGEFEYQFEITSDLASSAENRFEILLSSPQVEENRNLGIASDLTCNVSTVKVNLSNLQTGIKYLFKLNDQPLHTAYNATSAEGEVFIPKTSLAYGQNNLTLVASSIDGCNAKVINNALTINFAEIKEISSVTSTSVCGSGSATITAEGAPTGGSYKWYESLNAVEPIASVNGSVFATPNLTASRTYYVTAVNANGCESLTRKPVEAKVITVVVPEVTVAGNVLSVTPKNEESIQWFKDGVAIANATNSSFEVKETGSYSVQFSNRGCQTNSGPVDFLISGVDENPKGFKFNVFPNPVSDYLKIGGPVDQIEAVRMFSASGAKAEFSPIANESGQMILDIKNLKKGFYFLNISTGKNIVLFKVLKK